MLLLFSHPSYGLLKSPFCYRLTKCLNGLRVRLSWYPQVSCRSSAKLGACRADRQLFTVLCILKVGPLTCLGYSFACFFIYFSICFVLFTLLLFLRESWEELVPWLGMYLFTPDWTMSYISSPNTSLRGNCFMEIPGRAKFLKYSSRNGLKMYCYTQGITSGVQYRVVIII